MNKVNAFGLSLLAGFLGAALVMVTIGHDMSKTTLLSVIAILLIAIMVVSTVYALYTITRH